MFGLLMQWMRAQKLLPQISDTERQALEAGNVWVDGELFGGKPDFRRILQESYAQLSPEEQAFIDGPLAELCRMIDPYEIARSRRVPEEVLEFIKRQGFMGLIIPREYGGKGFSRLAVSTVMHTLSPYSFVAGAFVIIPNSLGAGELIHHYGTETQKRHYLPRLASGEYIPCFGLTEPTAGSDAASIRAEGVVFRDPEGALKIRLNFRKRYITLAPVANLCSIACQLHDPDNLLGKGTRPGITVVLVHKGTPGFTSGDHHLPIGEPFYNGPLLGKDVVVPVANIIGGPDYAGQGWKMLMEQLAGGRAISLPAGAVGTIKRVAAITGPYSMVRQQFGMPIGRMEGVEDRVGRIAAITYMMEAARVWACSAVDRGIQPPVTSGLLKCYTTELSRQLVIDGMDVLSGAGVMQGPHNMLGSLYASAPVSITVEGANIMTRTLMIFGQGATRCHPYALKVVQGVEQNDVGLFRRSLLGWIGHTVMGGLRSLVHGLTRGWSVRVPDVAPETRVYYRRLGWAAARFGLLTDLAMFCIGGKLKMRGKLTGRYSDALAWQFFALAALRRYEAEGHRQEDLPLVHYACRHALAQIQAAFEGIYANFDVPVLGALMRSVGSAWLRLNPIGSAPGDALSQACARALQADHPQFHRLTDGVFLPQDAASGLGRLLRAFRLLTQSEDAMRRIGQAQREQRLPRGPAVEAAELAAQRGIISVHEERLIKEAQAARLAAIEVDVFTPEAFYPAETTPTPVPERRRA